MSDDFRPHRTGQFPEGQLVPEDEGEILFEVGDMDGKVVLNFGDVPVQWIGMSPEQADELADILRERAAHVRENAGNEGKSTT